MFVMAVTKAETFLSSGHFRDTKYGKLRMKDPRDSSRGSHRKVTWLCDCGRETEVAVCTVVSGNTSSCRKCDMVTADHMRAARFGKLCMKEPADLMPGSRKKVAWLCDCGREARIQPLSVMSGHTVSCGRCNELSVKEVSRKFGKLRMKDPRPVLPGSHETVEWECDCGNVTSRPVHLVMSGHTRSCGSCNVLPPDVWAVAEYGFLTMESPEALSPGSNRRVWWRCRCGGRIESEVYPVTIGRTTRCGQCQSRASDWYEAHKDEIRALKTPFLLTEVPTGWIIPLEDVRGYEKPFRAICGACRCEYSPMWQMDFDHVSDEKAVSVNQARGGSVEAMRKEMAACQLVCAACHRVRTKAFQDGATPCPCGRRPKSLADAAKHSRVCPQAEKPQELGKQEVADVLDRLELREGGTEDVIPFLQSYHYAGHGRSASRSYVATHLDEIVAVVKFSPPVRKEVATSLGWAPDQVLELDRFCVRPRWQFKNMASKVMGLALSAVRRDFPSVTTLVSFADPGQGHTGTIYRATNWRHVGQTGTSFVYVDPSGNEVNKKRVYEAAKKVGVTEREQAEAMGLVKRTLRPKEKFIYELR
jgi:hypothetical protein